MMGSLQNHVRYLYRQAAGCYSESDFVASAEDSPGFCVSLLILPLILSLSSRVDSPTCPASFFILSGSTVRFTSILWLSFSLWPVMANHPRTKPAVRTMT